MNLKIVMFKVVSYLLFALSLLFLFIPSAVAYILGAELFGTMESFLQTPAFTYSLLSIGLSYLCHRFSKIKEISFLGLLFLFPCQMFIVSIIVNLFIPTGDWFALLISPIWILISLKIYQICKSKIGKLQ